MSQKTNPTLNSTQASEPTELTKAERIIIKRTREMLAELRESAGLNSLPNALSTTLCDFTEAEERVTEGKLGEAREELSKGVENFRRTLLSLIGYEGGGFPNI